MDRLAPAVDVYEVDSGYRTAARRGPRRQTKSIQWPPVTRLTSQAEPELRAFFAAIEGPQTPVVFWEDSSDLTTLMLCRVIGTYQATNVWGSGSGVLARPDQLILEEEL